MVEKKKRLSELASVMKDMPQVLRNVHVKQKRNLDELSELKTAVQRCEDRLKDKGRVFVRFSGTEPVVRVLIEGPKLEMINQMAEELAEILSRELS
jgi:phosphoglucosamine mutase